MFRKVISALWSGAALASAGCAILAHGGRVSGPLDVLAHLAPIYLVASVLVAAGAVFFASKRRGLRLSLGLIGILASSLLLAPEWTRSTGPQAVSDAPGAIKVIQINALRTNWDVRRTVDWVIAQNADVVAISEARRDLRDMLIARTGWQTAGAHGSLIIFTPSTYLRMNRPDLPPLSKLTFVNATYASRGGEMEIVTAHLDWPSRGAFRRQPADLESIVRRLPTDRMLLLGDFNLTPWSQQLQRLDHRLGLIRRDRGVSTFPAQIFGQPWPFPFLPIDHIYAGPGWATVKVERGPWLGSDHYPLIVTLAPTPD